jgi:hypothetical protein
MASAPVRYALCASKPSRQTPKTRQRIGCERFEAPWRRAPCRLDVTAHQELANDTTSTPGGTWLPRYCRSLCGTLTCTCIDSTPNMQPDIRLRQGQDVAALMPARSRHRLVRMRWRCPLSEPYTSSGTAGCFQMTAHKISSRVMVSRNWGTSQILTFDRIIRSRHLPMGIRRTQVAAAPIQEQYA